MLTVTASPSTKVTFRAENSESHTGDSNTQFTFYGSTLDGLPIEKGSSLRVFIPADFKIADVDRVASTCTVLTGFSDELSCEFERYRERDGGHYLLASGGFDSEQYVGGEFSFYISEIKNPFTTKPSASFHMEIQDSQGRLQYHYPDEFSLSVTASTFSFAFIESQSPVNGVSAIFEVTLSLGVDTPAGASLAIGLPEGLEFDGDQPFTCVGTLNVPGSVTCDQRSGRMPFVTLRADDSHPEPFVNGTTVTLKLGSIKNPLSFKPTQSFYVASVLEIDPDAADDPAVFDPSLYYFINENTAALLIRNSEAGAVTIESIAQATDELDQPTALTMRFTTQNTIPEGATMILTLPSNLVMTASEVAIQVDGEETTDFTVNAIAFQVRIQGVRSADSFLVEITSGLKNPAEGPYQYAVWQIELYTSDGYLIDKVFSQNPWIDVPCQDNCASCSGTLAGCVSCSYNQVTEISHYLEDGQCVEDCKSGFYEGAGYQCLPCESPCVECDLGPKLCTLCEETHSRPWADPLTLQCYDQCPDGTYADEERRQCIGCESPCYTCSSATECLSCDHTAETNLRTIFFAAENRCYEECPSTSVRSPDNLCLECTGGCQTCENIQSQCTSCGEGTFLHKSECIEDCPFLTWKDRSSWKCMSVGQLDLPVPFSLAALLVSVGIGISHFMKGADKQGREQEGTAFFISMLAIIDIMLRLNWLALAYLTYTSGYMYTFAGLVVVLGISALVNILIWRRKFYVDHFFEGRDRLFAEYCKKYAATAGFLTILSYLVTFQAIRLTYSRFLGKKAYMARFQRKRMYFRLIGRLSVLEILVIYLPAVIVNATSISKIHRGAYLYWLNIDSMILVCYAIVLIIVVLSQREKVAAGALLFKFSELFLIDTNEEDELELDNGPEAEGKKSFRSEARPETEDDGSEQSK